MRATGLQGDALPEIIEIIDDETDAFGDRASNTTIFDSGGPRWVGPVAAGVLVALMGYGVATSASSSGVPRVAPVTSTTVPSTTSRPTPSTTVAPALLVPYYAADPPREFTVQNADEVRRRVARGALGANHYELWATQDATATSGSWFSIQAYAGGGTVYAVNAHRTQVGGLSIAVSHLPSRLTVTQFATHGNSGMTINSFGWGDDDLVRLAASIRTHGDSVDFTDAWFTFDHRMLSSVQPSLAVQGIPAEHISYASFDDPLASVAITVAKRLPANEGGATLDRQIALRFLLDRNTPFAVDGHSAVAGTMVDRSDYALATWIAGDHIVTVGATMPLPQLIAIARTVHEVSSAEWEGMKFQARRNTDSNSSNSEQSEIHQVSLGDDADSKPWAIRASMTTYAGRRGINWGWDATGSGTTPDDSAQINTVVEGERTYVLADLPRAIAPTAELHVLRDGLDPVIVPFNDVDAEFDRTLAAYAFSEPLPYTAQIIGTDGAVLATWPSP